MRLLLAQILLVFLAACSSETVPGENSLRFFALGDWGRDGASNQALLANAMEESAAIRPPHFILSLGDNFYPDGVESVTDAQWQSSFENIYSGSLLQVPWLAALGNHDYLGDPKAEIDYSTHSMRWKMPHYFYSIRVQLSDGGAVRFVVLDTNPFEESYYSEPGFAGKFEVDSLQQKVWMDSIFSLNDSDWVIVSGHHPVNTGGARAGLPNTVRNSLLPIFSKYDVPVYFAGHEHDLQHLKEPGFPTHQFISGAGSEVRPTGSIASTLFSASIQGFMSVELTRKRMDVYAISFERDTLYQTTFTR